MADEKEDGPVVNDGQLSAEVSSRDSEVTGFLSRKDKTNALIASLQNPPTATKSVEIKDANAAIVAKVIAALQESEISGVVERLDLESCDTLMKYLYKFMGSADKAPIYPMVLKLHALVSDKAGVGSIVRVLSDRKQV